MVWVRAETVQIYRTSLVRVKPATVSDKDLLSSFSPFLPRQTSAQLNPNMTQLCGRPPAEIWVRHTNNHRKIMQVKHNTDFWNYRIATRVFGKTFWANKMFRVQYLGTTYFAPGTIRVFPFTGNRFVQGISRW